MNMGNADISAGREELAAAWAGSRGSLCAVAAFSVAANLLMLTGPLYMMLVYDRVLASHSVETLVALTFLVAMLYAAMAVLDGARSVVLARLGARLQLRLDPRALDAGLRGGARLHGARQRNAGQAGAGLAGTPAQDLEAVQRMLASPVPGAIFDLPWTPLFLLGIALVHPALGAVAVAGGGALVLLAVLFHLLSRQREERAMSALMAAESEAASFRERSETLATMGLRQAAITRWQRARRRALMAQLSRTELGGGFAATSRALRLFLQSAMLGTGAWLVLTADLTPGIMIGGSVLLGRALAPVEALIGQWPVAARGLRGARGLAAALSACPAEPSRTTLPRPRARIEMRQVTVVPPGEAKAALRLVSMAWNQAKLSA